MDNRPLYSNCSISSSVEPVPFQDIIGTKKNPAHLSWYHVGYKVDDKVVLEDINGELKPTQLNCLIGGSGAGRLKSGGKRQVDGEFFFNNCSLPPTKIKSKIAFVEQEDVLFGTQTAKEALYFSARLRLSLKYTNSDCREKVDHMLSALGLIDSANTLIPNLSGGERKRVSIGIELITSPDIIAADEVTSGLDFHSALQVIRIFKALSRAGCSVLCTIHQPSSEIFELFDNVLLLGGGRTLYSGKRTMITQYFATKGFSCPVSYNPADYVLLISQTEPLEKLYFQGDETSFRADSSQQQPLLVIEDEGAVDKSYPRCSLRQEISLLTNRELKSVIRDKGTLRVRIGLVVVLNVLLGLVFPNVGDKIHGEGLTPQEQNRNIQTLFGALTIVAIGGMLQSSNPVAIAFPLDRPVVLREHACGSYSIASYFISKLLVEIPINFLQSFVSFLIVYWIMDLNGDFIVFVLVQTLLGLVSASLALLIGASVSSARAAVSLNPAIITPQILFGGFLVPLEQIPAGLRWIKYICQFHFAMNLMVINEFEYNETTKFLYEINDIRSSRKWLYVGVLLAIFCFFRLIAFIVLKKKTAQ